MKQAHPDAESAQPSSGLHGRATETLVKAGTLQRAIFNSANFSIIATDAKGVIQIFNVGAERMLGYAAADVVNRITPAELSNPPELIVRAKALSAELGTPITPGFEALVFKAARGIEDIYELTYIRKNGSGFPAVVSVTALRDEQDAIIGYLLIGTDNTARKEAEVLLRDITTRKREEVELAQHRQQLEELVGERTKELEGARAAALSLMQDANRDRERLTRNAQALQEKEKALRIAKDAAEAANRAKSDFLASMSHELRTPLNAVIGFSEALEDRYLGDLTEKQAQYVRYITESGRHLLALINDILDLSKVEAGKMTLELGPVRVGEFLEDSLIMVKEKCFKHRIALNLDVAPDLRDREITADARKVKQILFNLLSNSAKFTPEGGSITLSAALVCEAGASSGAISQACAVTEKPWVEISVADTGVGIPRELQEKVFESFYQVKGGTKDKSPGTGLGLPLVKRLVELHGGKVFLESEGENRGCRFTFWLPTEAGEWARPC